MSASIFISFASEDRKVASTLCKALESRGFKCWFSSRDILPGENFQVAIVRAIRKAKVLLLVFTGNSNNSEEMTKELALASQERLIVVPLRVEDVAPSEAFAYEFATRQWIDFFADWELAIDQLCERLAMALPSEAPALSAEAASPALAATTTMEPPAARAPPPEPPKPEVAKPAPAAAPPKAETPVPPPAKPKAAAPAAAAPAPARPGPQLVRDSIGAEAPIARKPSEPEEGPAKKSKLGLMAAIAVAAVVLIGLGLAVPSLMGKKTEPPTALAAVPPKPVEPPPLPAVEPPPVPDEAAAEAEAETPKPAPKPKRKAPPKPVEEDVPY